tara:strand:- start:2810 stop:3250 length:441 start_codon:yes stop_codon:yes gene_type:complete
VVVAVDVLNIVLVDFDVDTTVSLFVDTDVLYAVINVAIEFLTNVEKVVVYIVVVSLAVPNDVDLLVENVVVVVLVVILLVENVVVVALVVIVDVLYTVLVVLLVLNVVVVLVVVLVLKTVVVDELVLYSVINVEIEFLTNVLVLVL